MVSIDPIDRAIAGSRVVIDIGAGRGFLMRDIGSTSRTVVGIEPDASLSRQAATSVRSTPNAFVCQADGRTLPFPTDAFDAALLIEVLEHIANPGDVLDEIQRVLRPGGHLCLAVPTWYTERILDRLHPRYSQNTAHVNVFRPDELREALGHHGLAVVHMETKNLAPAIAWLVHAILRTPADHTGVVLRHRWVDYMAAGLVRAARSVPLLRRMVNSVERHFGKSLYVVAEAVP